MAFFSNQISLKTTYASKFHTEPSASGNVVVVVLVVCVLWVDGVLRGSLPLRTSHILDMKHSSRHFWAWK